MADLLIQRKRWFGFFPEGTLEFLVITRVLAVILAGTLIIVPTSQRPAVLIALACVIWLDYALLMWWLLQLVNDLDILFGATEISAAAKNSGDGGSALSYAVNPASQTARRVVSWRDALIVLLPSILALLLAAPWPQFLIRRDSARMSLLMVLIPAMLVAYLAVCPLAYRCMKRAGLPGGLWTVLLLVPVAHWFALHRFLRPLHARVRDRALQQHLPVSAETGAGAAATASDVFWAASIVFWMLWAAMWISGRTGGALLSLVQAGSIGLGCLFAITQVAALEYLQRRFVALIRRARADSDR